MNRRHAWKAPALVLGLWGIFGTAGGCELIAAVDREQIPEPNAGTGGMGGATSSSSGTAGSGGGMAGMGGMPECTMPGQCPPPANECVTATCDNMVCGVMNVPDQTATPAQSSVTQQTTGDCKADVCDGSGSIVTVEYGADLDDDKNECTDSTCAQGFPVHTGVLGQSCSTAGGTKCTADGKCVECLVKADCMDAAKPNCVSNKCVADSCFDVMMNGSETDVDCGGMDCPPCFLNQNCVANGDCISQSCVNNKCAQQSCMDGIQNQDETAVDCGGGCAPCTTGQACAVYADCESGVCLGGMCQAHACNDWVKNGAESDVDCGGDVCAKCPDGKDCLIDGDCVSNSCVGSVCGGMGGGGMGGMGGGGMGGMGGGGMGGGGMGGMGGAGGN